MCAEVWAGGRASEVASKNRGDVCGSCRWCVDRCGVQAAVQNYYLLAILQRTHSMLAAAASSFLTTASSGRVGWKATQRACSPRGRLDTSTC